MVQRLLGKGGFGSVYLAVDPSSTPVAIKVLTAAACADPVMRRRIEREAAIARRLDHPALVRLRDTGILGDKRLYLVFDYVEGEDLSRTLQRQGKLPAPQVRQIICQLLSALATAHEAGVIHRDLKPENIRLTASGARLLDFGIARATEHGSPALTAAGELLGTPRYMSPEQLTNRPLDARSDLYSLGLIALEMLYGRDALHGGAWSDQFDRLRTGHVFAVGDAADHELLRAVGKMTARDPSERFGSARAVLSAIDGAAPVREQEVVTNRAPLVLAALGLALTLAALAVVDRPSEPAPTVSSNLRTVAVNNGAPPHSPPAPPATPDTSRAPVTPPADIALDNCGAEPDLVIAPDHRRPRQYDKNNRYPLLIVVPDRVNRVWHAPAPLQKQDILDNGGFAELASDANIIVVAHEMGTGAPDGAVALDDLEKLMNSTRASFCIDRGRVFVLGIGHGGGHAYQAACLPWVAGIATYAHQTNFDIPCRSPRKPMMLLLPNRNPDHKLDGGTCPGEDPKPSFLELQKLWRSNNNCTAQSEVATVIEGARCERFSCPTAFESCKVDGGRGWPGLTPLMACGSTSPPTTADLTPLVWDFFAKLPTIQGEPGLEAPRP